MFDLRRLSADLMKTRVHPMYRQAAKRLAQSPIEVRETDVNALIESADAWGVSARMLKALEYYRADWSIEQFAELVDEPVGTLITFLVDIRLLLLLQISDRQCSMVDASVDNYLDQVWFEPFLNEEMRVMGVGVWNALGKRFGNDLTLGELVQLGVDEIGQIRGLGVAGRERLTRLLLRRDLSLGMHPDDMSYWKRRMKWIPVPDAGAIGLPSSVVARRFLPNGKDVQYLLGAHYRGVEHHGVGQFVSPQRLEVFEFAEGVRDAMSETQRGP